MRCNTTKSRQQTDAPFYFWRTSTALFFHNVMYIRVKRNIKKDVFVLCIYCWLCGGRSEYKLAADCMKGWQNYKEADKMIAERGEFKQTKWLEEGAGLSGQNDWRKGRFKRIKWLENRVGLSGQNDWRMGRFKRKKWLENGAGLSRQNDWRMG